MCPFESYENVRENVRENVCEEDEEEGEIVPGMINFFEEIGQRITNHEIIIAKDFNYQIIFKFSDNSICCIKVEDNKAYVYRRRNLTNEDWDYIGWFLI